MKKYSIKEIAGMFAIAPSKIRHYESVGLLECKRDPDNNYRYFDDQDAMRLANILMYRNLGVPVDDIRTLMENESAIEKHMYKHVSRLNQEIRSLIKVRDAVYQIIKAEGDVHPEVLTRVISRLEEREKTMKKIDYDRVSKIYDSVRGVDEEVVQALIENTNLTPNARVLDLGCGTGNYAYILSKVTEAEVHGVDPSEGMLEKAKMKDGNMIFAQGTASDIPYDDHAFDLIYMTDVIHHVPDIDAMFKEVFRIAASGARICICTQSHRQIDNRYMSEFFPDTAVADKNRYPSIYRIIQSAEDAGFDYLSTQIVLEDMPVELGEDFLKLLSKKGYSMLHQISDSAYENGLALYKECMKDGPFMRRSAGGSLVWLERHK